MTSERIQQCIERPVDQAEAGQYDLGYFDDEMRRLEPIENPFGPRVLPLRSE